MNVIQKMIFFIGLLSLIGSILFVPYRVQKGYYNEGMNRFGSIEKEFIEFHFILKPPIKKYYDNQIDTLKFADRQVQLSIFTMEVVFYGGLIVLAKSKKKKEE